VPRIRGSSPTDPPGPPARNGGGAKTPIVLQMGMRLAEWGFPFTPGEDMSDTLKKRGGQARQPTGRDGTAGPARKKRAGSSSRD